MHNISNVFYFGTTLCMFRTVSPSIMRSLRLYIQHQLYVIRVMWLMMDGETETCRVLFQNKINLRYCASDWFYCRNILRCTVLQTSNRIIQSHLSFKRLTLRLLMSYIYMERIFLMFLDHAQRRSTVGRTPLGE